MLYLLYEHFGVNIFRYITFRSGLAFMLGFALCAGFMPLFISWAKAKKASQPISDFVPTHAGKKNTPTMGGAVFVASTLIATLFCANVANFYVMLGIISLALFALIGARDDYLKIAAKSNAGMSAKAKFFLLFVVAFGAAMALYHANLNTALYIPFMKQPLFDMGVWAVAFWTLVFLATTNAVNITDGLDGLATVPSIAAFSTLSIFVYVSGHAELTSYLFLPATSGGGEVVIISMALIGALVGFLWFNCYPAQVFMGDSGSLAIGGFMAYMAILSNNEILLFLIGFVFVFEVVSVILQVGSFKMRGKKIFLMAPIHHHFEVRGWAENKIIVRFWIIAILSNLLAILSLKIR